MKKVCVIADLCIDLLFKGSVTPQYGQVEQFIDDYDVEIGGSGAIFSSQFVKLGGDLSLCGSIGEDLFGNYLTQRLSDLNLSLEFVITLKDVKTSVGVGLVRNDDRAMLTYPGSMMALSTELVRESGIFHEGDHVHIVSYFLLEPLQDFWLQQLPRLKKQGITISLDTNWAPENNWEQVHAILPFVDIFLPNEAEAMHISGKSTVEESLEWLYNANVFTIVKCGPKGAALIRNDQVEYMPVPARLLENLSIADTTGAGDNFDAGFIYEWLQNKAIEDCLETAMICGTKSLNKIGGIEGQIKRKEQSV